jgi:hypothetical protein
MYGRNLFLVASCCSPYTNLGTDVRYFRFAVETEDVSSIYGLYYLGTISRYMKEYFAIETFLRSAC